MEIVKKVAHFSIEQPTNAIYRLSRIGSLFLSPRLRCASSHLARVLALACSTAPLFKYGSACTLPDDVVDPFRDRVVHEGGPRRAAVAEREIYEAHCDINAWRIARSASSHELPLLLAHDPVLRRKALDTPPGAATASIENLG